MGHKMKTQQQESALGALKNLQLQKKIKLPLDRAAAAAAREKLSEKSLLAHTDFDLHMMEKVVSSM
jgi:hypothetical protein